MRKRYGDCYNPRTVRANLPDVGPRSETVRYDRWTGKVQSIRRIWAEPDSVAWEASQDSIAISMDERGGATVDCGEMHQALTHVRAREIWRFEDFDLRLIAYSDIPGDASGKWLLQIDVFKSTAPECEEADGR